MTAARLHPIPTLSARLCLRLAIACLGLWTSTLLAAESARSAVGITEAVVDVTLSLAVPGIVMERPFEEGDFVGTNQVILTLDSRLEELEVDRRRLVMENRRNELAATRLVFEKGKSVSREELEKRQVDFHVATVEHQVAEEQLHRRRLSAPAAGRIAEMRIKPGEACEPYQPLVRLVDIRQCYFITNIEARDSAGLKVGQAVAVEVDEAAAPVRVEGRVTFVSPVVDPSSGLQRVKVLFDNADGRVRPGLGGRMILP